MEAVRSRHDGLVKLLLDRGAKPNLSNASGDTALVFAANGGQLEAVELLLKRGPNINGGSGWTPPMQASYCGWEDRKDAARLPSNRCSKRIAS